ncbi:MAG: hypothetical protein LBT40_14260 [Deltaproteobacteria bacterium]|jgi:hypothetical protein|nr:hypothetical protein [Deltaproteobacteria bacterium]
MPLQVFREKLSGPGALAAYARERAEASLAWDPLEPLAPFMKSAHAPFGREALFSGPAFPEGGLVSLLGPEGARTAEEEIFAETLRWARCEDFEDAIWRRGPEIVTSVSRGIQTATDLGDDRALKWHLFSLMNLFDSFPTGIVDLSLVLGIAANAPLLPAVREELAWAVALGCVWAMDVHAPLEKVVDPILKKLLEIPGLDRLRDVRPVFAALSRRWVFMGSPPSGPGATPEGPGGRAGWLVNAMKLAPGLPDKDLAAFPLAVALYLRKEDFPGPEDVRGALNALGGFPDSGLLRVALAAMEAGRPPAKIVKAPPKAVVSGHKHSRGGKGQKGPGGGGGQAARPSAPASGAAAHGASPPDASGPVSSPAAAAALDAVVRLAGLGDLAAMGDWGSPMHLAACQAARILGKAMEGLAPPAGERLVTLLAPMRASGGLTRACHNFLLRDWALASPAAFQGAAVGTCASGLLGGGLEAVQALASAMAVTGPGSVPLASLASGPARLEELAGTPGAPGAPAFRLARHMLEADRAGRAGEDVRDSLAGICGLWPEGAGPGAEGGPGAVAEASGGPDGGDGDHAGPGGPEGGDGDHAGPGGPEGGDGDQAGTGGPEGGDGDQAGPGGPDGGAGSHAGPGGQDGAGPAGSSPRDMPEDAALRAMCSVAAAAALCACASGPAGSSAAGLLELLPAGMLEDPDFGGRLLPDTVFAALTGEQKAGASGGAAGLAAAVAAGAGDVPPSPQARGLKAAFLIDRLGREASGNAGAVREALDDARRCLDGALPPGMRDRLAGAAMAAAAGAGLREDADAMFFVYGAHMLVPEAARFRRRLREDRAAMPAEGPEDVSWAVDAERALALVGTLPGTGAAPPPDPPGAVTLTPTQAVEADILAEDAIEEGKRLIEALSLRYPAAGPPEGGGGEGPSGRDGTGSGAGPAGEPSARPPVRLAERAFHPYVWSVAAFSARVSGNFKRAIDLIRSDPAPDLLTLPKHASLVSVVKSLESASRSRDVYLARSYSAVYARMTGDITLVIKPPVGGGKTQSVRRSPQQKPAGGRRGGRQR